jgi:flagellar hook protein FlgE
MPPSLWSVRNMSLFGAINTAVSGLTAQSTSFGNISEDVANSQTVGFKRVDTNFTDYLTTSTATDNVPGAVVATPDYVNNVQGTVTQTDNPLGMAIAGQGFFAVSQPTGQVNGTETFNPQQFYSRAGDFTMNASGYLVNSAGQYLNGWAVNSTTGVANQNTLVPIQVNQSTYNPVATQNVTLSANLPATPTTGTATAASPLSSQITVYDSLGTAHPVTLNWTQSLSAAGVAIPNQWNVQVQVPGASATLADGVTTNFTDAGSATVTFGAPTGSTAPPSGTISSIVANPAVAAGTVTTPTTVTSQSTLGASTTPVVSATTTLPDGDKTFTTTTDDGTGSATGLSVVTTVTSAGAGALGGDGAYSAGATGKTALAALSFTSDFGSGDQTINLNLGTYGGTTGVTQFAGSTYSLLGLTQDGVAPGSFSGVTTQDNGNVVVNYNNGQTRTIAQIPLVTFNAPDSLQSQNGQSFTATPASGSPLAVAASSNGAGNLVTGSVEGSNVDIATEFTNLIVAQQAYSSNAKVVTTANEMLQATLQMIS